MPATVPLGTYYVAAIADKANVVRESDESNNGAVGNQVVLANDLSITGLTGSLSGGVLFLHGEGEKQRERQTQERAGGALHFSAGAIASPDPPTT